MSKIICDICGTKYPDTEAECPICGFTNDNVAKTDEIEENFLEDIIQESRPKVKAGLFSRGNSRKDMEEETHQENETHQEEEKTPVAAVVPVAETAANDIFDDEDFDDEYDDDDDDDDEDDDEYDDDEEDGKKSGIILSILLTIVILALLCVSGFIFIQYVMPNLMASKDSVAPTETYVQTEPVETEEPTVPCTQLVLNETSVELSEIGQMYLLNVAAEPVDTTDEMVFVSSDEAVATVNAEGRVTAVGEGTAVVTVTCGTQSIECSINVVLPEQTEAPTEEPTEAPTEEPTEPEGEKGVIGKLDSDHLNIRAGAGTGNDVVGSYNEGDVVYILERKLAGGVWWGRTDKGWISLKYVKFN